MSAGDHSNGTGAAPRTVVRPMHTIHALMHFHFLALFAVQVAASPPGWAPAASDRPLCIYLARKAASPSHRAPKKRISVRLISHTPSRVTTSEYAGFVALVACTFFASNYPTCTIPNQSHPHHAIFNMFCNFHVPAIFSWCFSTKIMEMMDN